MKHKREKKKYEHKNINRKYASLIAHVKGELHSSFVFHQ